MEASTVQCQVCIRSATSRLPFLCTACARNALYEPRLQHVQSLLSKEALGREVEYALNAHPKRKKQHNGLREGAHRKPAAPVAYERATSQLAQVTERIETIFSHVEALQAQTKQMKADIAKRRTAVTQRHAALASAEKEVAKEAAKAPDPVEKAIAKTESRWNALHTQTVEARVFLCREVASLYGLQQKKRRKGVSGRDSYLIGGVPIVDIRDINSESRF